MAESKTQMVRLNRRIKKILDGRKKHPRQSYSEVIERIMGGENE